MENASKALIIAGAVLLSILIVGIGMAIFNGTRGTTDQALVQMTTQERDMFNAQFNRYEGKTTIGSNVRALCETINSNNVAYETGDPRIVKVYFAANSADTNFTATGNLSNKDKIPSATLSKIVSAAQYTVITEDSSDPTVAISGGSPTVTPKTTGAKDVDGLVSVIVIKKN